MLYWQAIYIVNLFICFADLRAPVILGRQRVYNYILEINFNSNVPGFQLSCTSYSAFSFEPNTIERFVLPNLKLQVASSSLFIFKF